MTDLVDRYTRTQDRLIDAKELAAHLSCTPSTIYHWANRVKDPLPHYKLAGRYRFDLDAVKKWATK